MFEKGNPEIVRHLAFRDYMMAHCEEAEAYATLKKNWPKSIHMMARYIRKEK